jgi:hypothetical protein
VKKEEKKEEICLQINIKAEKIKVEKKNEICVESVLITSPKISRNPLEEKEEKLNKDSQSKVDELNKLKDIIEKKGLT